MTRIFRAHTLPASLPERLASEGVTLVTLDLSKVLAPYRERTVYPDVPGFVRALRSNGITPVIATNSPNRDRREAVRDQLGGIAIFHPRPATLEGGPLRPKPYPDMLLEARKYVGSEGRAVHIDDQFKAYIAARMAGFDSMVWLEPRGGAVPDHPVSVALRPFEAIVCASLLRSGKMQIIE